MDVLLRHGGHDITAEQVAFLRRLIAENPGDSRWRLSKKVCEAWGWKQPNGKPRDMLCRGVMLALHRAGHIELPAPRYRAPVEVSIRNVTERRKPQPQPVDTTPLECPLSELGPLEWAQVRRTADEPLFNYLIDRYHYLGYTRSIGEQLKYLVSAQGRPIACLAWSSPPLWLDPRDHFIGWSKEARRRNLPLIAYNPRFLVMPWVRVPHLASHLLGRMARMLPAEWERVYAHPVHYLETFVDSERYRGTCYFAANWISVGKTKGYGKNTRTHERVVSIKDVLAYPLTKRFRELLGRVG